MASGCQLIPQVSFRGTGPHGQLLPIWIRSYLSEWILLDCCHGLLTISPVQTQLQHPCLMTRGWQDSTHRTGPAHDLSAPIPLLVPVDTQLGFSLHLTVNQQVTNSLNHLRLLLKVPTWEIGLGQCLQFCIHPGVSLKLPKFSEKNQKFSQSETLIKNKTPQYLESLHHAQNEDCKPSPTPPHPRPSGKSQAPPSPWSSSTWQK